MNIYHKLEDIKLNNIMFCKPTINKIAHYIYFYKVAYNIETFILNTLLIEVNIKDVIITKDNIYKVSIIVWGYIIILFSLLGLIIIQIDANENPYTQLNQIPYSVYVLAVIVLWIIILNITYTKYINKGSIPPTYTFWNKWSTIFIGIITILILMQLFGKINEKKPSNLNNEYLNKMFEFLKSQETTINVYLGFILFLNVLIAGIQTTILANFRVDG